MPGFTQFKRAISSLGIEFTCLLTPVLVQPGEGVARLHLSVRTLSQAIELSNKVLYHSEKEFSLLG